MGSALDACTLLSSADVTAVLGTPAGTGVSASADVSSRCTFALPAGPGPAFSIPPDSNAPRTSAVVLTVLAEPMTAAEVEAGLPPVRDMTYVQVAGLGDGAWWSDFGPTNQAWGRTMRVAFGGRVFLVILYGPPTDPSTWQAAAVELARRVINAVPNGWPATSGGSPLATLTASAGAGLSDPLCDPLVTASGIEAALGASPTSVVGNPIGSPGGQYGQGVGCIWRFADGSTVDLTFEYEFDQSYVTFKLASLGTTISGLGESAAFLAGSPNTLGWGVGSGPARMLYLTSSLDETALEAIAHAVTIPVGPTPTAANLADAHCDPWLTAAQISAAAGLTPISVEGDNYLNEGQPVDCTWTFADGSSLNLTALEDSLYGGSDSYFYQGVLQPGAGMSQVFGLPGLAFAEASGDANFPPLLHWFPDDVLSLNLGTTGVDLDRQKAIAMLVTVPANWQTAGQSP